MDLRLPTGSFFLLIGAILLGMAVLDPNARAALTGANVNLYCGLVMLAFGAAMLGLARRARRRS